MGDGEERNGMNILFLTLLDFKSFSERNIYCDLLREFIRQGHDVYCISPAERRTGIQTHLEEDGRLLKLRIGNTQKTNMVEKGISTVLIEPQFTSAIKKYFPNVRFDLVLYSTPPITLANVVKFVKKRDNAVSYLLLKDIFPQNAVDIGMMSRSGIKGMLYSHFRKVEKRLYAISDYIGCMSPANVEYVLHHNPKIDPARVGVCPNSIEPVDMSLDQEEIRAVRIKYGIPLDKQVFVYGGNFGKPQGIPFLIDCLRSRRDDPDVFFLIIGDGTEYDVLRDFIQREKQPNVRLMDRLPRGDYDKMVAVCDVGLIFLDHRFTIPNFPSRVLSYMQAGLPVLAVTDPNTDVGKTIVDGGFGWWCESDDVTKFSRQVDKIASSDISQYKHRSWQYLCDHYSVREVYSRCFAPLLDKIRNEKNGQ